VSQALKRVLFVCVGNACRSQMAEAFARVYGSDVLIPASVGLRPAFAVAPDTVRAMEEKGIDLRDHFPKSPRSLRQAGFDLVVNLSGRDIPSGLGTKVIEWSVEDPIALSYKRHCEVRDLIERLVMDLVLELRNEMRTPRFRSLHRPR
jgi:arsenate reductase (thioredoxin)